MVFLYPWTGDSAAASEVLRERYPNLPVSTLCHGEIRRHGFIARLKAFRALKGRSIVFFFKTLDDAVEARLLPFTALVHGCTETVLADESGAFLVYRRLDLLRLIPSLALRLLCDVFTVVAWYLRLAWWRPEPNSADANVLQESSSSDLAYLYPFPLDRARIGGALTHVGGVLSGFADQNVRCRIYSSRPLPRGNHPLEVISSGRRACLLREGLLLSYNLQFARHVHRNVKSSPVRAIYHRHGRFVVAGALLSKWLHVPLILEYNGSEDWIAQHWDPCRFRGLLRLCEARSLSAAAVVVVVSEALRDELLQRGIPAERIAVIPNAVDPAVFCPNAGGVALRTEIGFTASDVVVGFLGTFSYWHGVEVLKDAIHVLCSSSRNERLRFLMIGHGPMYDDLRRSCASLEAAGTVVFTHAVPHEKVPAYLDACDILVSPHIPMPDGSPFFGSPTKLFEYMAMSKPIIASNLDQIGRTLVHGESAWLVPPGDVAELCAAIEKLAGDPEMRSRLGATARKAVLAEHTWSRNAAKVMAKLSAAADSAPDHGRVALPGKSVPGTHNI